MSNHSKLHTLLSQYRIEKGSKNYTHVSLGNPQGAFNIPDDKLQDFYDIYVKNVLNGEFPCIGERHREVSPILIDFDFKFPDEEKYLNQNNYSQEDILNIVKLYSKYINYYFKIANPDQLKAYIFEKEKPYRSKGCIKNGLHITYPEIWTTPDVQYVIRRRVLEDINTVLKLPVINNFHDIIDESVIERNCWLLLGSRKPEQEPYRLTMTINDKFKVVKVKPEKINKLINEWITYFSIRRQTELIEFRNEMIKKEALEFYENNILNLSKDQPKPNIKGNNKYKKRIQFTYEEINELVSLLKPERADTYFSWIELGWCLHNISVDLFDIWDEFSRRSPKYKQGETLKLWAEMKNEGLYIGTLIMWARSDNLEGYKAWEKKDISRLILNSVNNFTHTAIAEILFRKYGHEFVCASQKHKLWYRFEQNRWVEIDNGCDLRSKISSELVKDYLELLHLYSCEDLDEITGINKKKKPVKIDTKQHIESLGLVCPCRNCQIKREKIIQNGEIDQDVLNEIKENIEIKPEKFLYEKTSEDFIKELTKKLQTRKFKDDIMVECQEIFYDRDFINKLDNCEVNEFLICCGNGVYDLKNKQFREGRPEDYISLSTNIDYIKFDDDNEVLKMVKLFLSTVIVDSEILDYVMKLLASYLQGANPDEKFHIFTGSGANGKSKIIELLRYALGEYAKIFPIELLTQKKGKAGTASPDVADGKGKRFGTFQEPGPDEKIQVGLMKEYSGGDTISCRPLYKPPIEFKPRWKLLLTCNDLPNIPSNDDGTWRRLRVVEFKSKFVDERDYIPGNKYLFVKDRELSVKMRNWKEAFLYLLIQYYHKYEKEGLVEPDEIIKYTRMYQEKCDIYAQFISDSVEIDGVSETKEKEFYNVFKAWYWNMFEQKAPSNKEFREYLTSKRKDLASLKKGFYKVKLLVDETEQSDD